MFRAISRGLWSHRYSTKFEALKLTMLLHCKPSFVSLPPLHRYSTVLSKTQGAHVTVVQLIAWRLFACFVKIVLNHDHGT